jgi:predicted outer membrane repeat protein
MGGGKTTEFSRNSATGGGAAAVTRVRTRPKVLQIGASYGNRSPLNRTIV